MNKHIFHHEKQPLDKSTVYDGSTEEPQEHMHAMKQPKTDWFTIIVLPICIWLALGLVSVHFNIGQGDLRPHNWVLMNFATGLLLLFWSTKAGVHFMEKLTKTSSWGTILSFFACLAGFVGSFFYLVLLVIDLINK